MSTITFKPTFRPQTRQISVPRQGRTHLSVHAVTNWILEPKKGGQTVNLTESIAKKQTAYVKSGGGDFKLAGLEDAGLNLKFRSEGAGQSADSPADLFLTDEGSDVDVSINNDKLQKGKEVKLAIGQTIEFGSNAYQVQRDARAHA